MPKAPKVRKQRKRPSVTHKDLLLRLLREATAAELDSFNLSPSTTSSSKHGSTSPSPQSPSLGLDTLNYSNILLLEELGDALDNRTAVIKRLEHLMRDSGKKTPTDRATLKECLRLELVSQQKFRSTIEVLKHSEFISALAPPEDWIDIRDGIREMTAQFEKGTKNLCKLGDRIASTVVSGGS
ncbi:hypothetical protein CONPUDRAFT_161667 [Coniophora puteana RWD-64-598 SS2]|uniref:Uncharacterized protein n=1 Tax=Coniophora puteana (strain RWD-64-598) TaxID=741705 RepID=A0A5M3N6J0_CONPW|nr:uncharacterized protein CONPUDRAFT_161667 [Coniophora puteana RWD-64-598 SS2]EIW87052.1 hypothetical protein CONPUDRAFT_161667 [Coniophora puteana RWD-64-598 SS2]